MKKFILSLLLALSCLLALGQSRIIVDRVDSDTGLRTVATSEISVRNGMADKHPMLVGIIAQQSPRGCEYFLQVAFNEFESRAVPVNGVMLIRTAAGEVLELNNVLQERDSRDFVGSVVQGAGLITYRNTASYRVTMEQLRAIASGVVKVRVETASGPFDTIYKKDPLGDAVTTHLAVLLPAISKKNDIKSDF